MFTIIYIENWIINLLIKSFIMSLKMVIFNLNKYFNLKIIFKLNYEQYQVALSDFRQYMKEKKHIIYLKYKWNQTLWISRNGNFYIKNINYRYTIILYPYFNNCCGKTYKSNYFCIFIIWIIMFTDLRS